jgi:hypothetical protein
MSLGLIIVIILIIALFGGFSGRFGGALIVPTGAHHNVVNTRVKPLKLYTIYSPPQHRSGSMPPPRLMPGPRSRISTARLPNDVWGERTSRSRHGLLANSPSPRGHTWTR